MSRFRLLAATSLAAITLLAACGEDSEPAATVNGVTISQDDLIAELEAIDGNEAYVAAQEAAGNTVRGDEAGTFNTAFVSQVLRLQILYGIVSNEIDERGIEIPEDCQANAQTLAEDSVQGAEVLDAFGADYRELLIERNAEIAALQAELSGYPCTIEGNEEVLQAYFDEHSDEFEPLYCASVIQVADQAAADAAIAQLDAGVDFADVSASVSTDPELAASGGDVGCLSAGQLSSVDPALVDLAVGAHSAPITVGDGAVIIVQMNELQAPSLESQRDAVITAIGNEIDTAFGTWADESFAGAEVEVDPRYGTWDPTTYQINRPVDEGPTTTTVQPAG